MQGDTGRYRDVPEQAEHTQGAAEPAWGLVDGLQRAAHRGQAQSQHPEHAVHTPRRTWLGLGFGLGCPPEP